MPGRFRARRHSAAACYGVPLIVVYRVSPILWYSLGWLVKTRTYSLVNLLSDDKHPIVPEFIPWFGSMHR